MHSPRPARPADQPLPPEAGRRGLVPEAHVTFLRAVTNDSVCALLAACQTLMGEGVEHIHLGIGSGGGGIVAGLAAFNQLRGLPLRFTTYNLGSVDSVAILPFLLGRERVADPWSTFLFHGVSWAFAANGEVAPSQVADAHACIASHERVLSGITAACTGLPLEDVRRMRAASTIVAAEEAVALGIASRTGGFTVPRGGRWWVV
ncbi:ATP-dependent Clp protease proteolytic subunit [Rhodospirillum centenum]|uniref:ATP-dependent Clp protease proteolytic subunit n=1 Tax=Rhodospirillum centenum TaxID=34018 RepID=UPI0002EC5DD9|nr:ATP-dependent Clp protease proteolytic subunit [Rhodospirillum centenum]